MEQLFATRLSRGQEFSMEDGTMIKTVIVDGRDSRFGKREFNLFLNQMIEDDDMIVGLDTEWSISTSRSVEVSIELIKFCTRSGCMLLIPTNYNREYEYSYLHKFFADKDIVFAGVHIKRDLKMLRKTLGIEVKNAVELSELAATVLKQPRLSAYSFRKLAREVSLLELKPRPWNMKHVAWRCAERRTVDHMECATVDAYATYKIAKRLLS